MGPTPHTAASNVIVQKRTLRRASIIRRGIAHEFEHDFGRTPTGRSSFLAALSQIARSVQETANVEGLRALLNCHGYQAEYVRKYEIVPQGDLDAYHERRAAMFMIVQKDEKGIFKLATQVAREQEMWGGKGNMWIVGREIPEYISTSNDYMNEFWRGGQQAIDRINGNLRGKAASDGTQGNVVGYIPDRLLDGCDVYIAKSNFVEHIGKADLLTQVTEIGSYNIMADRGTDPFQYTTQERTIRVMDFAADNFADIELREAIENCVLWDRDGNLVDPFRGRGGASGIADPEYDFLSNVKAGGGLDRENITQVGHMYPNWIDIQHIYKGALTALKAAVGQRKDKLEELLGATEEVPAVTERVRRVLGLGAAPGMAPSERRIAVPINPGDAGSIDVERTKLENEHLTNYIGGAFRGKQPYVQQVKEIVARSAPFAERAQAIKALVLKTLEESPGDVPVFESAVNVDHWFDGRVKDFKKAAAELTAKVGAERVIPVGQELPAGYRWKEVGAKESAYQGAQQKYVKVTQSDSAANLAALEAKIDASFWPAQVAAAAKLFAKVKVTRDSLVNLCDNHVYVPFNPVLFSPHMTCRMRFMIKMQGGMETGFTAIGHGNMQVGHENTRKVGSLHYTTYLSAIVTNPKNVYVAENVYCEKYLGGRDVSFWTPEQYKASGKRYQRSIICHLLPPKIKKLEQKVDVRGRWYTELAMGMCDVDRASIPLFPSAGRLSKIMGWQQEATIRSGRPVQQPPRGRIAIQYCCWQAFEQYWNSTLNRFDDFTYETGPLGQDVGPGLRKVMDGKLHMYRLPANAYRSNH